MRLSLLLLSVVCFSCGWSQNASVKSTAGRFLERMADARMMDAAEGELATKNATTTEIRQYGELMVRDQNLLLGEISKLANEKDVELPKKISDSKSRALAKLAKKSGEKFDRKFLKMMKIDHKRDVREFSAALESQDTQIASFAEKFLPLIKEHLEKAQQLLDQL